jgi:carbamoyltransferase
MIVLGINGIEGLFHDASATLVADNRIVASVEEERFNRKKHTSGIPVQAIDYCLNKCDLNFQDIDRVGYYLDPYVLQQVFVNSMIKDRPDRAAKIQYYAKAAERMTNIPSILEERYGKHSDLDFQYINHHLAHAASAYYISGADEAAVLTVDGAGDKETMAVFHGKGPHLSQVEAILTYPKSLGFIYTIMASHLYLGWIEGPGKMMGLAGYGSPDYDLFQDIIHLQDDPHRPLDIDLSFFDYHIGGQGLSEKGLERFGQKRLPDEPLGQEHMDLAASVQWILEKAVCHVVSKIPALLPGQKHLCLAGGIGLNVCSNRKILDTGYFERLFITPPAYDGGTSLGCALYLNTLETGFHSYDFSVYLGPDIEDDFDIVNELSAYDGHLAWERLDEKILCRKAAQLISEDKIIGWIQGRMECGPRALGNRSYLTNPMNPKAKALLNGTVKKRESFRPYAPSVLNEHAREWFDLSDSPYMLLAAKVLPEKRHLVPGIVHVDGTARPQTVTWEDNPRYYRLLNEFHKLTGVPMVLNTSFNRHGEPIANRPKDAIKNLLSSEFDSLFMGDFHITIKDKKERLMT